MQYPEYISVIGLEESIKRHAPIDKHDLLYPLWEYNISLPIVEDNNLNALENVVYELIDNNEKDFKNIAELTGLNEDLVEFIISRLQQLDLVNNRMQTTDYARKSILEKKQTKYISATVYFDIKNKTYLPKLAKGGLQVIVANKSKNKYVFHTGTSGESKEVRATLVRFIKESAPKLTPNEALNIIRRYRNTLKKDQITNVEGNEYINIPLSSIEIANSPQIVYLHRQAFIPQDKADIFVTNGFNGGVNPDASRNFERHNNWVYKKLKEKANTYSLSRSGNEAAKPASSRDKLDNAYQGLINVVIDTSKDRKAAIDGQADFFKGMYSEIEHLLAESALSIPAADVVKHIHSHHPAVNGRYIRHKVKDLGFIINKLDKYFFSITKGALKYLNYSDPDMASVITINVISTEQSDRHPLIELARVQPIFFEMISQLEKMRNAAKHGDINEEIIDKSEIKRWYRWFETVSETLGDNIYDQLTITEDKIHKNMALSVSVEMDKYFNWYQKNSIPLDVVEVIKNALKKKIENNPSDTVTECASALQKSFYHASKSLDTVIDTSKLLAEDSKSVVANKIGTCELKNIHNSSKYRIERACQGVDSTLGANAMAFIYRANISDLEACPNLNNFLPVISRLIELRGHNRKLTESDISTEELKKLLTSVFEIINDLMEHFGE